METVRIAAYLMSVPAALFGVYCVVSAAVSVMEDRRVDCEDMVSSLRGSELLTDLRKAA